jgi:hypothetical protein
MDRTRRRERQCWRAPHASPLDISFRSEADRSLRRRELVFLFVSPQFCCSASAAPKIFGYPQAAGLSPHLSGHSRLWPAERPEGLWVPKQIINESVAEA